MAKADIDFEKELWDAANELRGAVSENNYKNYILPLVFVKHLSERYEVVREELKEQLNDPKSDYYTTDKEEINYVLEDRAEYRSRNTFTTPETTPSPSSTDTAEQHKIHVQTDAALDLNQLLSTGHNPQRAHIVLGI